MRYLDSVVLDEPKELTSEEFVQTVPSPLWAMRLGSSVQMVPFTIVPHRLPVLRLVDQYLSYRLGVPVSESITHTLRKLARLDEPRWIRMDADGNMLISVGKDFFVLPALNSEDFEVVVASPRTLRRFSLVLENIAKTLKKKYG